MESWAFTFRRWRLFAVCLAALAMMCLISWAEDLPEPELEIPFPGEAIEIPAAKVPAGALRPPLAGSRPPVVGLAAQTADDVLAKSHGCLVCHENVGDMHRQETVKLGCCDCHGGNPNATTEVAAHVHPLFPGAWRT